jgi:hypothetical protein
MTDTPSSPDRERNTADMLEAVRCWVWYGSHSPAELDEQIGADAEDGEPFDADRVKAFAADELARKRSAEAQWPDETDCDRLDRAFERLRAQRICALHFPDTGYTLEHGQEALTFALEDAALLGEPHEGYCYYHGQDIERALDGAGLLLAFGSTTEDDPAGDLRTGRLVCEALALEGLQPVWDGTAERRIAVPALQWRRRTPA